MAGATSICSRARTELSSRCVLSCTEIACRSEESKSERPAVSATSRAQRDSPGATSDASGAGSMLSFRRERGAAVSSVSARRSLTKRDPSLTSPSSSPTDAHAAKANGKRACFASSETSRTRV
eukprot:2330136-Pleurochrysis_carterae.AAC.3